MPASLKNSASDARIDWSQSARAVHDRVRGFNPWPCAWTELNGERLKIWRTRVIAAKGEPGAVIKAGQQVLIACGSGAVELLEVQLPGKRRQAGQDLANTGRIPLGTRLI